MKRVKRVLRALAVLAFWLTVWQLLALRVGRELLLPGPAAVLRRLGLLAMTASFWRMTGASLLRVLCGILAALLAGTALAALCCRFPLLDALTRPLLTVVKSTPVASFIILAQLWLARSLLPGFISTLIVLPVVFSNVAGGIRATDPALLELARVFRFSRWKTIRSIYVPSALPWFLSACKSVLGLGWKAGIAAEVLTVPAVSVGKMLMESKLYLETVELFAWTAAVVLCSLLIERLVLAAAGALERRLRPMEEGHD